MVKFYLDMQRHDSSTIATYEPVEPAYDFALSAPGSITCSLALSHRSIGGTAITADEFAPKKTDYLWKLSTDNGLNYQEVQGGICDPVNLKANDQRVRFSGRDWMIYFDQPYPFAGYNKAPSTWLEADVLKFWTSQQQQTIITAIIAAAYDGTVDTIQATPTFSGTGWTEVLDYYFDLGDTSTMLDHIMAVGALNDPYGFNHVMDWDKTWRFFAPRRVTPASVTPIANFTWSSDTVIDLDWTNEGPLATETIGAPPDFPGFGGYSTYAPSVATYRRWRRIRALNDTVRSQAMSDSMTASVGYFDRFPQKRLSIVVKPDLVDPLDESAFFFNHCGKAVYVDSEDRFSPYHRVQAAFWILDQKFTADEDANWQCAMTLGQIY